tara:strand:- start:2205 stop:2396 length:192 start_codon:yes stop_codon:yes gene_type:complete
MPDITVSFTDAQWTRIVAASSHLKDVFDVGGDVDEAFLATKYKRWTESIVKSYEKKQASVDDF